MPGMLTVGMMTGIGGIGALAAGGLAVGGVGLLKKKLIKKKLKNKLHQRKPVRHTAPRPAVHQAPVQRQTVQHAAGCGEFYIFLQCSWYKQF